MATYKKLTEILVPLSAKTAEGLSQIMFHNNIKDGKWYDYSDPSFQNKVWITWYLKDIENEINDNITPIRKGT